MHVSIDGPAPSRCAYRPVHLPTNVPYNNTDSTLSFKIMINNNSNDHDQRREGPKISTAIPTANNPLPNPKIPAVGRIHRSHNTSIKSDTMGYLGEGSHDNETTMHRDHQAQENVTVQDLQAMKQMIREIRQNPELLCEQRREGPKISTAIRTANNHMPNPKIPSVIRIRRTHSTSIQSDTMVHLGEGDYDNETSMQRDHQAQEKVTVQDLQAMKQMISEIRQNPELLCEYSATECDAIGNSGEEFHDNETKMLREDQAQEKVTAQDLQAMKQMVGEIRQDPKLLYEYSTTFSQYNRRNRRATVTLPIARTDSNLHKGFLM